MKEPISSTISIISFGDDVLHVSSGQDPLPHWLNSNGEVAVRGLFGVLFLF